MTAVRFLRIARQRLTALVRPGAVERALDRELAFHFDALVREKMAAGLPERDAIREAHRDFGAVRTIREQSRDALGLTAVAGIVDDARYGWRLLRRAPGFTTVAGLALAVGIGATAAAAGVVAFLLARPLPFASGDRLVRISTTAVDGTLFPRTVSIHQYRAWQAHATTISALGASRGGSFVIADGAEPPERVQGQAFTPSLFTVLGIRPAHGRVFDAVADPFDRRARVAIISYRLWQRRYRGATDAIGRRIQVDGASREIVGVMPEDFRLQSDNVDLWIPLIFAATPADGQAQDMPLLLVTARLSDGATIDGARAELEGIARELHPERPAPSLDLASLRETLYGWTRPRLATLGAMAALLLTLACANVAALLLARGALRRRELAMRVALGASRRRLVRQLLTESLVLGLTASVPAAVVTWAGLRAVAAALAPPPALPRLAAVTPDAWVFAIVATLCVLSSIGFGALPALAASRVDATDVSVTSYDQRLHSRRVPRWRSRLLIVQIALAEVLLVAGALLTISYLRLSGRELNLDPRGILSFTYTLRANDVIQPITAADGRPAFTIGSTGTRTFSDLLSRLEAIPGSGIVGAISFPPVNSLVVPMVSAIRVSPSGDRPMKVAYFLVTPKIFAALRTPVLAGREFDARDARGGPPAVVVNDAFAALCCPDGVIGQHLRLDVGDDEPVREIVGVVGSVPTRLDQPAVTPAVYVPYLQHPLQYRGIAVGMFAGMTFVLRTDGDAAAVLSAARAAAAAITPDRPLDEIGTVQAHLHARLGDRRSYVLALDTFALLAALLAIVGLHGVMTHDVVGRTNEIAVRRALGARGREILALVSRPSAAVIGCGVGIGAALALAASGMLAPQLWGVTARDAATFTGITLSLMAAASLGGVAAARRALSVDPASGLRRD